MEVRYSSWMKKSKGDEGKWFTEDVKGICLKHWEKYVKKMDYMEEGI